MRKPGTKAVFIYIVYAFVYPHPIYMYVLPSHYMYPILFATLVFFLRSAHTCGLYECHYVYMFCMNAFMCMCVHVHV